MKRLFWEKAVTALTIAGLIWFQYHTDIVVNVSAPDCGVELAVLMYHGFTRSTEESTYVLNEKKLEDDIVYLIEKGYRFVGVSDLADYCDQKIDLPPKCVMLTFDDGCLNNYTYAYPIIKKYGVKAVISPIAKECDAQEEVFDDNPAYAAISWSQALEMSSSGLVEIQNHSYAMHSLNDGRKGSAKASGETSDEYRQIFAKDLIKAHMAIKKAVGVEPVAYAYPYGSMSEESVSVLQCLGYRVSFGCSEGVNLIDQDRKNLYGLKRFNRTPDKSAAKLLSGY